MAQRSDVTPPKQQALSVDGPDVLYSQPRSESDSPPVFPEPKPRHGVFSIKISGGEPDGGATHIETHPSYNLAWDAAQAAAEAKKEELEEQAKLAGNPTPNVMVLTEALMSYYTVMVDGVFRWRYQVEPVKEDLEKIKEWKQQSMLQISSGPQQRKRQDTPAQANTSEAFMQGKRELGGSPSASLAGFSTSAPEDHGEPSKTHATTVGSIISDEELIEIPPEPTNSDFEGETVADDESLPVQDIDEVVSANDSLFNESAGALADTSAALPGMTSEPALTQHLEPPTELTADTTTALKASDDASQAVDHDPASSQKAQSDVTDASNADLPAEAPIATKLQIEYGPAHFGLYLTLTHPPAPAATYRIQLNTSLDQAQSDMKLIVTNEVAKARAQGVEDDMKLEMDVNKIDIVHKNGSRLSYEIAEGAFADGTFSGEMERSGRVVDGESYTRAEFEKATRESERVHRETLQSTMAVAEEGEEFEAETHAGEDIDEDTATMVPTNGVEETGASPRAPSEVEDAVLSPLANVSRKRKQSPLEAQPTDAPTQNASASQEAPTAPSPGKREVDSASPRAGRPESHDKSPSSQNPTPIALHAPIKKRGRAPEEPTLHRSGSTAAAKPARKKARLSPATDTEPDTNAEGTKVNGADDPNALFCRCRQRDDGSHMFACDGEACPNNGWAHMACFPEMKEEPEDDDGESKWYCPDCDPAAYETAEEEEAKPKKKKRKTAAGKKKAAAAGRNETAAKKGGLAAKKGAKKGGSAASRRALSR